ncbi:hypothetical protein [Gluconacetobacter asukensis]|uniref:Uncharacterized protein n=1 Tax=Gluconacetobacter asukensis TaxID=1017181 RepID=A0A7W4J1B3_9PROT|nr:hypothetical protein [Gluconacetobacter asukensis]MBB2172854.1 hypothetical protein [Gluconacetobacter asukensis]
MEAPAAHEYDLPVREIPMGEPVLRDSLTEIARLWAALNPRASMHTREYLAALVHVELMGGVMELPASQR